MNRNRILSYFLQNTMSSRQKITIRRELELWQLSMYLLPEALSQVLEKESQQLLLGVCSRHAGTQLQCRNLIRTSTLTRVQ